MRSGLLLSCFLFSLCTVRAQYKSFRLSDKGDTLNAVDMKGLKQGKWSVHINPLRGEPGYDEEGLFVNDRKEGIWRRFNTMGDPIAVESYRWGNKNGPSRYFTIDGIEREESWRAINPDQGFDTVEVVDPVTYRVEKVIVKNAGVSLRHGRWKYYDPKTGKLLATENYFLDKLKDPDSNDPAAGLTKVSAIDTTKAKPVEKPKPKEVLDFEKKTSGKKKSVRNGSTGG